MLRTAIVIISLSLFFSSICHASIKGKECTKKEAIEAENEIDGLSDWDRVYSSFKRFAHCDDGAISEGYSDVVGHLLSEDWKNLLKLLRLTASDIQFKRFVIKHLDETIPNAVAMKIHENVNKSCPADAKQLCKLIECQLTIAAELAEPAPLK